jgi:hypothetical protein
LKDPETLALIYHKKKTAATFTCARSATTYSLGCGGIQKREREIQKKTRVYYIRVVLATNKGFKTCPPEMDQR